MCSRNMQKQAACKGQRQGRLQGCWLHRGWGGWGLFPTCGRARTGTLSLRRPAEMLRAAPWRTPPVLALQGALGDSGALLAVLRSGEPSASCASIMAPELPQRCSNASCKACKQVVR